MDYWGCDMVNPPTLDWARYPVPSADMVFSETVPAQLNFSGTAHDCSAWPYVLISMDNFDSGATLLGTIAWQTYIGTVEAITADQFVLGPGQFLSYVLPTKGRNIALSYSTVGAVPSLGTRYGIEGLSHEVTKYQAKANASALLSQNVNMAANSTQRVSTNYWYEGPVMVTVSSHLGGPATCALEQFDAFTANWLEYSRFQVVNDSASVPFNMHLAPEPARFNIMNGGTAQTVQINVIPRSSS